MTETKKNAYRKPGRELDHSPPDKPRKGSGLAVKIPLPSIPRMSLFEEEEARMANREQWELPFGTHKECPKCGGSFSTKLRRRGELEHLERTCDCGFFCFELCKDARPSSA
jgi:hypothetical protein